MKNTDRIKVVPATLIALWIPSAASAQAPELNGQKGNAPGIHSAPNTAS